MRRRARASAIVSVAVVCLGLTLVVETAVVHGRAGYLLGAAIALAGAGRLYLSLR